jgi:predicted acylesterase/phospholipase RssA
VVGRRPSTLPRLKDKVKPLAIWIGPAARGLPLDGETMDSDPSTNPGFPCESSGGAEEVGLALSGGGYRATLFHLGALNRLNDLRWLQRGRQEAFVRAW